MCQTHAVCVGRDGDALQHGCGLRSSQLGLRISLVGGGLGRNRPVLVLPCSLTYDLYGNYSSSRTLRLPPVFLAAPLLSISPPSLTSLDQSGADDDPYVDLL